MAKDDPFDLGRRALNSARKAEEAAEATLRRLEQRDAARARRADQYGDDLATKYPALKEHV